jgi:RimJ/RimL family protein N-acetyltransferase
MTQAAPWLLPVTLASEHATLVPLDAPHASDLQEAVRDGELWKLWYTFVPSPDTMADAIATRLGHQRNGTWLPFAVLDPASGRAVGMTNYMHVEPSQRRVEIGGTWYRQSVQRTPLNTACKLLLLEHAFERLDCIAVEFRTHFFNHASRRAIERLGAKLDGVLRNHQRMPDGTLRDTCVYSILQGEWPTVKAHLTHQLARAS